MLQVVVFLPSCFFSGQHRQFAFSSPLLLCVGRRWSRQLLGEEGALCPQSSVEEPHGVMGVWVRVLGVLIPLTA